MQPALSSPPERRSIKVPLPTPSTEVVAAPLPSKTSSVLPTVKEIGLQTEGGRNTHRLAERKIQELLDADGKVAARIIKEHFFPE